MAVITLNSIAVFEEIVLYWIISTLLLDVNDEPTSL
jgi:hypothetical protein